MPINVIYGAAGSYISVMRDCPTSRAPEGSFRRFCGARLAVFKKATATTGFLYSCVDALRRRKADKP